MNLQGAIYQTNGRLLHASLAATGPILSLSGKPKPPCPARKAQCKAAELLTTSTSYPPHPTAPDVLKGGKWSHEASFNIPNIGGVCHRPTKFHALQPHPAESQYGGYTTRCCASHAMPYVSAIPRFKPLSHRLFVDLSVLRANLTGWRKGLDFSIHASCAHPAMPLYIPPHETTQPSKRRHPNYHWTCIILFQK
jgi:hypothetical protein